MISNELFFPIRYERSRPFINKLNSICKGKTNQEIAERDFQMTAQNIIFDEMVKNEEQFPPKVFVSDEDFNSKLSRELNFYFFYYNWLQNGRNIFHLTKELIELFENTEVGDIPLDIIQMPFSSFYISFVELDRMIAVDTDLNQYDIDGVFIVKSFSKEKQIDIFLNGIDKKSKNSKNWLWGGYASLVGDWFRINYSEEKNTLEKAGYIPKFLFEDASDAHKAGARAYFNNIVNIVFNALCYLSSKQEIPKLEYPKNTPAHLLTKLNYAKTKHQKEIIKASLATQGYTKISFIGHSYRLTENQEKSEVNSIVATHWRRGFWRNQPFGQGLQDHKLIWIKPTIVNKDKGEPSKGRIYKT